jgi:SAM-dependent methyltransferase
MNPIRIVNSLKYRTGRLFKTKERECPLCKCKLHSFAAIDPSFLNEWQNHSHNPMNYETLNIAEYSCPNCGASDRERIYALYLQDKLPDGANVLEFGPTPYMTKLLKYFPVNHRTADLFQPANDKVDIQDMPYPDASFDIFLCSHILEHVADDRQAISELHRILKPGGFGIAMVPIDLSLDKTLEMPVDTVGDRWKHFGQNDHVRAYSKQDFVSRLENAGFEVEQIPYNSPKYGIRPTSVLYVCHK